MLKVLSTGYKEKKMYTVKMEHAVPETSRVLVDSGTRKPDYIDSFSVALPLRENLSVDYLSAKVFLSTPAWFAALIALRNLLVSAFGLKTGFGGAPSEPARDVRFELGARDCYFTLIDRTDDELVMGEGDRHLDFRVSTKKKYSPEGVTVFELTTVVWYNNWLGPIYFNVVKPFHRLLIRRMAQRASTRLGSDFGNPAPSAVRLATLAQHIARWLGLLGGLGMVALGVMHYPLAFRIAALPAFAGLSRPASDFLILLSLCVGLLLLLVGALTIYFSPRLRRGDSASRAFFLMVTVALLVRTLLDVLYPLTILGETTAVFQNLSFTCCGFVLPVVLAGRRGKS